MSEAKENTRRVIDQVWVGGVLSISVKGAGEIVFDPSKAAGAMRRYAEEFGWSNRFMNAAAKSVDASGRPASPAEKHAAILALVEHYEGGAEQWTMGSQSEGGLLLAALCELAGSGL